MIEVTELEKSLVDEALYLRGRIVAAYAHVEFLLADISVVLDLRFPYRIDDRIKAVRRIAERDGYQAYKDELDHVCKELLKYEDIRHFMTHGFLTLTTDEKSNHQFEFLRYRRDGKGKFTLLRSTATIEQLRKAVADIGQYVSDTNKLFKKIYREKQLEQKPEGL